MLFPRPRNAEYFPETYRVKADYSSNDLLTFYNRVKNGNEDISVTVVPFLQQEEYRLQITQDGI